MQFMARRKSNKIEPAVLTFALQTQTLPAAAQPGGAGTAITPTVTTLYADYSQIASLYNRRFYRQGLNWASAGMKMISSPTIPTGTTTVDAYVTVSKLPNTWVTSNAWEKGMRTWLRQQNEAIDLAGMESAVARFRDFKIFADPLHVNTGYAANWLPPNYTAGEWDPSLVVVPNEGGTAGNTQEFTLHMVGDDDPAPAQSKALIRAYAESRSVPFSPDPVTPPGAETSLYVQMFDTGEDHGDIIDNAIDRNDNLPYPQMDYPGGDTQGAYLEIHDQHPVTSSTLGGTTRLKGGNFPCGLVKFQLINYSLFDVDMSLLIDMVPGHHRGYLAESMVEM